MVIDWLSMVQASTNPVTSALDSAARFGPRAVCDCHIGDAHRGPLALDRERAHDNAPKGLGLACLTQTPRVSTGPLCRRRLTFADAQASGAAVPEPVVEEMDMKQSRRLLAACLIAAFAPVALAHSDDAAQKTRRELGRVLFKTSCTAEAQQQFDRALAMLHSFYFPETVKAFNAIPETDPGCAIAWWGIAISQRPNPLVGPWDAATLKRGLDAVQKGESIGAKTQRERDWLAALKEFYKDYDKVDQDTRTKNYEQAMGALSRKYPNDVEAKVFHALALNEIFDHKSMAPLTQAIAILEPLDKKYPDHPGITHYLIHSYDFAPIAQRGVPAANKYAKVAPAAPHAQHMPSHIYSMVGMWQPSIDSNLASVRVATEYAQQSKIDGVLAGVPHAYDFMEYAYLQLGQDGKAKALIDENAKIQKVVGPVSAGNTARAAVPARYYLERQDWAGAAKLAPQGLPFAPAEAITHFARAMGAAHLGDVTAAQADIAKLKELRSGLLKANQGYWAEQVEVQVLGAQAWVTRAQGDKAEAQKLMRAAADLEDGSEKHVAMENRLYPMRELLADMLLADGDAATALKEYEVSMKNAPNRLRGWYGAAKAATAVGDAARVVRYSRALEQLTQQGDGVRPEVLEMRPFAQLAQR
jgi:tetratricopeptide (TPR) repeat protein